MTHEQDEHDHSVLTASLASIKSMLQRALEERDEEAVPKHSAAVVDRMTADYKDETVRRVFK